MTLNQLKYAIIVAESESFNEAAKKLFISQPSLSTSIHSLEEEIGVQIFRRSQNGIAVTPDGKEFIGYARQPRCPKHPPFCNGARPGQPRRWWPACLIRH